MGKLNLIEQEYSSAVGKFKEEWFSNSEFEKWYSFVTDELPEKEKIVYLIVILHEQVINGGFHQYFVNGYGQFASITIECLKEVGAFEKAKLLRSAYGLINKEELDDHKFRKRLIKQKIDGLFIEDSLYEPLGKLDDEFYDSQEEIEHLLVKYLIKDDSTYTD